MESVTITLIVVLTLLVGGLIAFATYQLIEIMYEESETKKAFTPPPPTIKREKKYEWKEGKHGEEPKYFWYYTNDTDKCPFCGCTIIFSGSWAPETCTACHASFMMGTWVLEKKRKKK